MLGKNENECEYAFLPSNVSQKSYHSVYGETLYGPIILTKSLINCLSIQILSENPNFTSNTLGINLMIII